MDKTSDSEHPAFGPPRRRMADHKVDTIVNSPWMRLSLYLLNVVVAITLALFSWTGGVILDRLNQIDAKLNSYQVDKATNELRIKTLETYRADAELRGKDVQSRLTVNEYEIRALKENRKP